MTRATRNAVRVLCATFVALAATAAAPPATRATGCPTTHGQYTSVLCNGDDLVGNGAYMVNGNIRMYMQQSTIETRNMSTSQNLWMFYSGLFGDPYRIRGLGNHFEIWDDIDNVLYDVPPPDSADSNGYMKLLSDGCFWHHRSDDTTHTGVCEVI